MNAERQIRLVLLDRLRGSWKLESVSRSISVARTDIVPKPLERPKTVDVMDRKKLEFCSVCRARRASC